MLNSDPSLLATAIKLVCVIASIAIGARMAVESQRNAVQRRDLLLRAVREGIPRLFLSHLGAFLLNLIFLWMLQVAVITLLAVMVGSAPQRLFSSPPYMLIVSTIGLTLPAFVIVGKQILPHRVPPSP